MGLEKITRRNFLQASGLTLIALAAGQMACNESHYGPEAQLLKDFLTHVPQTSIGRGDIEKILYEIAFAAQINKYVTKNYSARGRAISIGDGYFLTTYHVVAHDSDFEENAKIISEESSVNLSDVSLQLVPQSNSLNAPDNYVFPTGFEIVAYDKDSDLALLKAPVEKKEGKAKVHLAAELPKLDQGVSAFVRGTDVPKAIAYDFALNGVNYYDGSRAMNLGKLILPANSLFTEIQGWVLPYHRNLISDESGKKHPHTLETNGNFSSILSRKGYSGSPVFLRLNNGNYQFAGIADEGIWIKHMIPSPGEPFATDPIQQSGTIFTHRVPIERLIRKYIPTINR